MIHITDIQGHRKKEIMRKERGSNLVDATAFLIDSRAKLQGALCSISPSINHYHSHQQISLITANKYERRRDASSGVTPHCFGHFDKLFFYRSARKTRLFWFLVLVSLPDHLALQNKTNQQTKKEEESRIGCLETPPGWIARKKQLHLVLWLKVCVHKKVRGEK